MVAARISWGTYRNIKICVGCSSNPRWITEVSKSKTVGLQASGCSSRSYWPTPCPLLYKNLRSMYSNLFMNPPVKQFFYESCSPLQSEILNRNFHLWRNFFPSTNHLFSPTHFSLFPKICSNWVFSKFIPLIINWIKDGISDGDPGLLIKPFQGITSMWHYAGST